MKFTPALLLFLLQSLLSPAQILNQDVTFDFYQNASNNDFVNYFGNGPGLLPSTTGGITGGCLIAPDSINWGNDDAIFCSHYKPVLNDTAVFSICFLYDSSAVHPNSFQRPVSIFLHPYADFNHYIIASVSLTKKIEIITYGWIAPNASAILLQNHWYRFVLKVKMVPSAFTAYTWAEVLDLGTTGLSAPLSSGGNLGSFTDNILTVDTSIQVSFSGAKVGGAVLLDNFHFRAGQGVSTCPATTGISEAASPADFQLYASHGSLQVTCSRPSWLRIYQADGRMVFNGRTAGRSTVVDGLGTGLYVVSVDDGKHIVQRKAVLAD